MRRVKAVIFDWDNTIVNSIEHLILFHIEVGKQLGWPVITVEQVRAVWDKPFDELIQALWPTQDSKQFDVVYRQYILHQTIPAISGAVTTITLLKESFLLGILTGAPRYEVEHFLYQIGLNVADFFMIQASEESMFHKPDPHVYDPFIVKLREMNIDKCKLLYVGDSLIDFYAARDAHLQFIAVLTGITTLQQFQRAGVSNARILASISDLPNKLVQ